MPQQLGQETTCLGEQLPYKEELHLLRLYWTFVSQVGKTEVHYCRSLARPLLQRMGNKGGSRLLRGEG